MDFLLIITEDNRNVTIPKIQLHGIFKPNAFPGICGWYSAHYGNIITKTCLVQRKHGKKEFTNNALEPRRRSNGNFQLYYQRNCSIKRNRANFIFSSYLKCFSRPFSPIFQSNRKS